MTRYPLATGDAVHYAAPFGFTQVWMTPDWFLLHTPPLYLPDEESDHYIQHFVERIRQGLPLDPPWWSLDDHDGRHRATAAKIAGVTRLPVMVPEELIDWLLEWEFAEKSELECTK
jgi:hypothetical protein